MVDHEHSKAQIREQARKHRSRIDVFAEDPEDAARLFFETITPTQDKIIAAYAPKGREFDALCVLEAALDKGHKTVLPVMQSDSRILKFHEWDQQTVMRANTYGIEEPFNTNVIEPDIIITPLLAFDRRGTRLGQGGGYYDATLKHYRDRKNIIAVGMAYSTQAVLFNLPSEDHDEALDWVITPKEAHFFGEMSQ